MYDMVLTISDWQEIDNIQWRKNMAMSSLRNKKKVSNVRVT
jgi:hypothetical protein